MNPFLIAGGIGIGIAIISFALDSMTDSEKTRQSSMYNDFEAYKRSKEEELKSILENLKISEEEFYQSQEEHILEERRKFAQRFSDETERFLNNIREKITEQMKEKENLQLDLDVNLNRLKKILSENEMATRKSSFEKLRDELYELKAKNLAYMRYLKKYEKNLNYIKKIDSSFNFFSFILPPRYPYLGKLEFFSVRELKKGIFKLSIDNKFDVEFEFTEYDNLMGMDDDITLPILVEKYNHETHRNLLSYKKGEIKNLMVNLPKVGIEGTVEKYNGDKSIDIRYKEMPFLLKRKNLENPLRYPPIGSHIRVYPIKGDVLSKRPIEVSEKYEDSIKSFHFTHLPMIFDENGEKEFITYIKKSKLDQEDIKREWKVGLFDEKSWPDSKSLKLQMDNKMVIEAQYCENNDKAYFRFVQVLPTQESFKPDNIYIPLDVTLDLVKENQFEKLDNENFENMSDLQILFLKEFKNQLFLKSSQKDMIYFNKWSEVTEKLINYLTKSSKRKISVKVNDIFISKNWSRFDLPEITAIVENPKLIEDFLNKNESDIKEDFFLEIENSYRVPIEFDITGEKIYLYTDFPLEKIPKDLKIYKREFCYPEIQQKIALDDFRASKMTNSILRNYAITPESITSYNYNEKQLELTNGKLNNTQKNAVVKIMNEDTFFMIQGPPGTGKTTVIKEIISQEISINPYSRILVVSQANVAIDNVLKDLPFLPQTHIIRAGKDEKIDDNLKDISFSNKYEQYKKLINSKEENVSNKIILKKWKQIVYGKNGNINSTVGELILKNHPIIGATCVGLMQKHIGLDRIEFDLVIIDEAGKALPSEIIIPLNRAKKIIMIGDHLQLPPVIHPSLFDSEKIALTDKEYCNDELFSNSFFKRLYERCPETNKLMLDTQYRMPKVIGELISTCFYDSQLKSGGNTLIKSSYFFNKNLNFIDFSGDKDYFENDMTSSVFNEKEVAYVRYLVEQIRKKVDPSKKIAVICPYKGQNRKLRHSFPKNYLRENNIYINTIDAFQGDEAEIVLYCMTRAKKKTKYFSDYARLNVAFSRAKNELIILGSMKYIKQYHKTHVLNQIASYITKSGNIINSSELKELQ